MRRRASLIAWAILPFMGGVVLPCLGDEQLAILPGAFRLEHPMARPTFLVERKMDGHWTGPVGEVQLATSDPNVFKIEEGRLVPVGNGKAMLKAAVEGKEATAEVEVVGVDQPFAWSFRNDVQSVLTKAGCNSGACHGAAAGKKGFKLSLRGFDAEGDYDVLLRQAQGRRVNVNEPEKSLILTKATAAIPHGGGKRMEIASREYQVLSDWIADAAPPSHPDDRRIDHLEVLPEKTRLKIKNKQPLVVLAHFSDGRVEDVTRWAKYTSANAESADVDEAGVVSVVGNGESAISVWYLNKIALASVSAPYEQQIDPARFADSAARHPLDRIILDKLQDLNIPPSGLCSDEVFIRRAFLDTIGVLPTPDEVKAFLADTSPTKRDALIDALLERPEFIDYWTYKFSDLLLVNSERLRPPAMWAYHDWVRSQIAGRRPWDQMVRELLTAEGDTLENGATNFFVLHPDTRELIETVSVAFMGLSINCARCHNHPLERWTNDEYFAFANLVSRVRQKGSSGDGRLTVYAAREGDLVQPLRGKPQVPRPLDGKPVSIDSPEDRRVALADWLASPGNPYFTRAIVNRLWVNFMGRGLVEAVDDLRLTNPPSNPALLDELSRVMVEAKYDLRSFIRVVLQSTSYQRSSETTPENSADKRFYSHYYPRRLMAEVMMDALSQATGAPTAFPGYPAKWRAMQLPDSKVASYFLDAFGRPKRDATCECERAAAPSMVQSLHIANGDSLNAKLSQQGGRVDAIMNRAWQPDSILEEIYLVSLSRLPSEREKQGLLEEMSQTQEADRRAFVEDLMWSLLSSKEFQFNH